MASAPPVIRSSLGRPRKPMAKWVRYLGNALFYGLGYPLTRLLGLFGLWPRILGKGMARANAKARDYTPTEHDVLVCSYFKTGTNWTMQIAVQIAHRGEAQYAHIHDLVPWLEMSARGRMTAALGDDTIWQDCPTQLRVIKTHASAEDIVDVPEARYVWVVRDPKDVFVSSYHFVRSTALGGLMPTPAQWLDLFLSPNTPAGSWAVHAAGAWAARHRPNAVFLAYEEMKADLPGAVRKIAALMGVDLAPEEFDRVVAQSTYAHMKTIEHKFDMPDLPWNNAKGAMVRRGERGSAGEMLDPHQKRRIDDYWRSELHRLGSDFPYDRMFGDGG